jgi:hypothetical protein
MAAYGFNRLQADQDIKTAPGEMHVGRQVILFPQLNSVFVSDLCLVDISAVYSQFGDT